MFSSFVVTFDSAKKKIIFNSTYVLYNFLTYPKVKTMFSQSAYILEKNEIYNSSEKNWRTLYFGNSLIYIKITDCKNFTFAAYFFNVLCSFKDTGY